VGFVQELFLLSVSKEVWGRRVRPFCFRGELYESQYQALAVPLLVNIDRGVSYPFRSGKPTHPFAGRVDIPAMASAIPPTISTALIMGDTRSL
jgi:hypothetical protein